jgi:arginine/lysine/ornithine decarboxylase
MMTRFGIGFEMADLNNLLGIMSLGDTKESMDRLIEALKTLVKERGVHDTNKIIELPDMPDLIITPRDAFYGTKKEVELIQAVGEISGEMLMAYPPGIPIICPGERITKDIIDYVQVLKEQHATLTGTSDPYVNYISVLNFSS